MSSKPRRSRSGRGHDATGRSKTGPRFVQLFHWFMTTPAWQSLPPASRAVYLELARIYNGSNNGNVALGVRRAARLVNIAKDTASKCFRELEAKGFIRRRICGSFDWKLRHETTWILTEHAYGDALAAKDFARWDPEKSEAGPNAGPACPKERTTSADLGKIALMSVLASGLTPPICAFCQSVMAVRL